MIVFFRLILNKKKSFYLFIILILVTIVNIFIYYSFTKITSNSFDSYDENEQSKYDYLFGNDDDDDNNVKYVQLLTGRFDYKNWALSGLGFDAFKECREKRCFALRPFYLQYPLKRAHGVIVHGPNLFYMPDRKKYKRNRKQIWMYYSMESPRGSYCSMHYEPNELDDWFNLTATFKQDSNFVTDYKPGFSKWSEIKHTKSYIKEYKTFKTNLTKKLIKKSQKKSKKAPVLWLVSHCETSSRRENYVNKMLEHIDIDIYGKCDGYFPNVKSIPCSDTNFTECFADLVNSYKFYLAFENSLCDDYISEKYWKFYTSKMLFKTNILPIVRGAKRHQYELVTNMSSLIFADDFNSPKTLALYLNYLNFNSTAYLEYFKWKLELFNDLNKIKESDEIKEVNFQLQSYVNAPLCYMCEMLHNNTYINSNSNPSWKISQWFSVKNSCRDYDENRKVFFWFAQLAGYCF